MSEQAQALLMMFINDGYSQTGKITKKTAIAMVQYVASDKKLCGLVNHGSTKDLLKYRIPIDPIPTTVEK